MIRDSTDQFCTPRYNILSLSLSIHPSIYFSIYVSYFFFFELTFLFLHRTCARNSRFDRPVLYTKVQHSLSLSLSLSIPLPIFLSMSLFALNEIFLFTGHELVIRDSTDQFCTPRYNILSLSLSLSLSIYIYSSTYFSIYVSFCFELNFPIHRTCARDSRFD